MRMEHWFYAVPLRLRSLFRRRQVEQELDEELQYHLERKIGGIHRAGADARQARRAACARWTGSRNAKRNAANAGVNLIEKPFGISVTPCGFWRSLRDLRQSRS